ncbi:MAG: uracil-DNA glycosylase [Oscillospiraceae bacterium]|nr:uracil-DNA glycosylase [Oscillospiraceae bacterium]
MNGRDLPQVWKDLASFPDYDALLARADEAYAAETVYPPRDLLFAALAALPPERVRCVILGQDPYHEPGQAMGLAFSVPEGCPLPPSLRNIFRERESDLGLSPRESGDLRSWAEQGVLLLNTVLTVPRGRAGGHKSLGWQAFTDAIIQGLSALSQPIAFILWGADAQKKESLCHSVHPRLILKAPHPSPLSSYRGFFGSRPFSQVNAFLSAYGADEINW